MPARAWGFDSPLSHSNLRAIRPSHCRSLCRRWARGRPCMIGLPSWRGDRSRASTSCASSGGVGWGSYTSPGRITPSAISHSRSSRRSWPATQHSETASSPRPMRRRVPNTRISCPSTRRGSRTTPCTSRCVTCVDPILPRRSREVDSLRSERWRSAPRSAEPSRQRTEVVSSIATSSRATSS